MLGNLITILKQSKLAAVIEETWNLINDLWENRNDNWED